MMKLKFDLKGKFEPRYSYEYPIYLTNADNFFCGRVEDDGISVNVIHSRSLICSDSIRDEDKITAFLPSSDNSVIYIALKNLYIKQLQYPTMKTLKFWRSFHTRPIFRMAVNQDCSRLATGSGDTNIRIWHMGAKEGFISTCRGHSSMITLLRFHPTETFLFSSSMGEYNVLVWDTETGAKVASLDGHQGTVTGITFEHLGNQIATCGRDKVIILWSFPQFVRVNLIPAFESLETCLFLPMGALSNHLGDSVQSSQLLLTGGQWGCLRVWEASSGQCMLEINGPMDRNPHTNAADGITRLEDRNSSDYGLHSIVAMDIACIQQPISSGDTDEVVYKLVLTRQSNHIEFYDPMNAKLISEFLGDIGQVDQLCIAGKEHNRLVLADASPNLKLFVRPCGLWKEGDDGDTMSSWSCHLAPNAHTDVITDLAVSGCGEWIISGSNDQSICLWRLVEPPTGDLSVKSKPKDLAVKIVRVERLSPAHAAHVSAVAFDHSNSFIFSAADDNVFKTWRFNPTGASSTPIITEWSTIHGAHTATVNAIDVAVNNQLVATASRDKTAKIWSLTKDGLKMFGVLQGHRRGVWSVCFSKLEKVVLTAAGDGDIRLWNLKDFSCIKTIEGQGEPIYKAIFLSTDRQILSCDQKGLVHLWDVSKPGTNRSTASAEGEQASLSGPKVFDAHDGRIWSFALLPDESGFYTGGEDATLCYFQDITEQLRQQQIDEEKTLVETRQVLENLVENKELGAALRLAVKLDQPKRALDLLQNLVLLDDEEPSKPLTVRGSLLSFSQMQKVKPVLDRFLTERADRGQSDNRHALVERLLDYAINWNTRSRTCAISQYVINWILSTWPPEKLLKWPGMERKIESLIPYTARHYRRISRLDEQLTILDYLCDLADENYIYSDNPHDILPNDQAKKEENSLQLVDLSLGADMEWEETVT